MRESGIYKITNTARGKVYVGSAVNLYQRRHSHFSNLRLRRHPNAKLQNAFNKYGENAFVFDVLELADTRSLAAREQHWMDALDAVKTGYNIFPIARSSAGVKMKEETKQKLRAAHKGKKLTKKHIAAVKAGLARVRDRVRSPEEIAKRAAAATGKKHTAATKRKIRAKALGRVISAATRKKIAETQKGRPQSEALRRALAAAHIGSKRTEETKAKMRAAQKLRFKTNPPSRDANGRLQ